MIPVKLEPDTGCNEEHLIECEAGRAGMEVRCSGRDGEAVVGGCLLGRLRGHSGECVASDRCPAAYSSEAGKNDAGGAPASFGSQMEIHVPGCRSAEKEGRMDG